MTKDRLAEIIVEAIRRDIAEKRNMQWLEWLSYRDEVLQHWRHLVVDALSEAEEDERERP